MGDAVFDMDLLITFSFMGLLFLRQVYILKQANKINYAPLMLSIGVLSSLIHFIIHPEVQDTVLLLRESLFPLVVSLLLFIIMNILHQTQQTQSARTQQEFTKVLVAQVTQMKEYMAELEQRMIKNQEEDRQAQADVREKFKKDIVALNAIETNQIKFLEKFDEMGKLHKDVLQSFEYFANTQLPELDNVVHKHIDILRVSEQDHHNKVKLMLSKAIESRGDISEDIHDLKQSLSTIKNISQTIATDITTQTMKQLQDVTNSFETQIITLKSYAEAVKTSLSESENTLSNVREKSEMLMKQMVLSSKKMSKLEMQNDGLHNVFSVVKELMSDMEIIKADYVKSQSQLSVIANELKNTEAQQIHLMKDQIETLSSTLTKSIDDSLEKLHEHYHIAEDNITQSVQVLAKKVQSQNGYKNSDI